MKAVWKARWVIVVVGIVVAATVNMWLHGGGRLGGWHARPAQRMSCRSCGPSRSPVGQGGRVGEGFWHNTPRV
jgi:hypothetical protein